MTSTTSRIAAATAAAVMTILIVGSQLGLVDYYTAQADVQAAAHRANPALAQGLHQTVRHQSRS